MKEFPPFRLDTVNQCLLHATAAELYRLSEKTEVAEHHAELSRAAILRLADSLPGKEPLRKTFLSAPPVLKVLGDTKTTNNALPRILTKRLKSSSPRRA